MNTRIYSSDGTQYQKPGFVKTTAGVVAGTTAFQVASLAAMPAGIFASHKMQSLNKGLNSDALRIGLNQALGTSGMANAGVKIVDLKTSANNPLKSAAAPLGGISKPFGISDKLKTITEPKQATSFFGRVKAKIIEALKDQANPYGAAKAGRNAFYNPATNQVVLNTEKLGLSGFHEIGHSINANSSKFWGRMQKLRKFSMFAPLAIGAIAIFKRKKADGEETNGVFDKVTTFIKNNAGKLTLASMLPMVAEELKASARGNALAKKILSPELAKKVVKANRWGALSYIATAGVTALAVCLGSKIRDAIAGPKPEAA